MRQSREGALLLGHYSESRRWTRLMQPRLRFHHLLPKYLITGNRKSPLENRDPSSLLRAQVALTPAAGDPSCSQSPGPAFSLGPGRCCPRWGALWVIWGLAKPTAAPGAPHLPLGTGWDPATPLVWPNFSGSEFLPTKNGESGEPC